MSAAHVTGSYSRTSGATEMINNNYDDIITQLFSLKLLQTVNKETCSSGSAMAPSSTCD